MSNKILNILVETQGFFEFFLQKYSKDFFLQEPKSGCEAQYAEWREKKRTDSGTDYMAGIQCV